MKKKIEETASQEMEDLESEKDEYYWFDENYIGDKSNLKYEKNKLIDRFNSMLSTSNQMSGEIA